MSDLDITRKLAKQTLTTITPNGTRDSFFWDRSKRLVRNINHICRLPELTNSGLQIDQFCLISAAYFNDVGLLSRLNTKNTGTITASSGANGDNLLEYSTEVIAKKFKGVIEQLRIDKINRIIIQSGNRFTKMTEAMILSDARNLDDMGATGILNEFRRHVIGGKSVSDMLQIWKRKLDYGYWEARLKENFRFETVRKLAEERLRSAEFFMDQLKIESEACDFEEVLADCTLV